MTKQHARPIHIYQGPAPEPPDTPHDTVPGPHVVMRDDADGVTVYVSPEMSDDQTLGVLLKALVRSRREPGSSAPWGHAVDGGCHVVQ